MTDYFLVFLMTLPIVMVLSFSIFVSSMSSTVKALQRGLDSCVAPETVESSVRLSERLILTNEMCIKMHEGARRVSMESLHGIKK